MGAYLNKPNVEKESEAGEGLGLMFGASTMQGWRATQEDAHNCLLGLADDWSMFAVYDGHGGSEVSRYVADNFPQFLKEREFWKSEEFEAVLQKIFVDFDDVLRSESVMKELKKLANAGKQKPSDSDDSSDEADRIQTIEESCLPLEELIAKYGVSVLSPQNRPLITKKLVECANEALDPEDGEVEEKKKKKRQCKSPTQKDCSKRLKTDDADSDAQVSSPATAEGDEELANGKEEKADGDAPKEGTEEAESSKPGSLKKELEKDDSADASEDDDESDSSFMEEFDDEEEDDEDEDEDEDCENIFIPGGGDVPGEDSGTTACVCFLSKEKVVVANAGDSRAILCRDGKAIDLSVDHKPEDTLERNRIEKAGGFVNEDGRVNGGLNLSRALGDHSYKKNNSLSLSEQMISAMPDVRVEKLQKEDEFLVVACDGIWNSMESQDVADFVRERFAQGKTCKEICEDLCDNCLADSTAGDGTGCDNMTVIITKISH